MLTIDNGKFLLDGKETKIYSGAIHYFRTLPQYWEDRLTKLKLAGFNTVETYTCWNLHEPVKGTFDFSDRLDIDLFLSIAEKLGLNVILRPGPYICAEWDLGGLPAWLLKDKNIRLRCNDPIYLAHVHDYFTELFKIINKHFHSNGGCIIAVQIENEYGSYANDKDYLNAIKQMYIDLGIKELLFTSDGTCQWMLSGGTVDNVFKTLNFGSGARTAYNSLKRFNENTPKMCMEFWAGWFDFWGGMHHRQNIRFTNEIKEFLSNDWNFNIYMFHGGTNFGFTAGANYFSEYAPQTTSYDYGALLTEWGDYTPNYHIIRKLLLEKQNLEMKPLPESPKLQTIGDVDLTSQASIWDNLDNIGKKFYTPYPESMEYYGQNAGLIYYKTVLKGKYESCSLTISDLHDRAYLYIDGKHKKTYEYKKSFLDKLLKKDTMVLPGFEGQKEIGVLVDALGHVNYGEHLVDRKGISGIRLKLQNINGFEVTTLPLDNIDKVDYSKAGNKYPIFFKGTFKANSKDDCFVHMDGFTKGYVYINGFNLGRYWSIGPQKALYLPGALLKDENEIVILELENNSQKKVSITNQPDLG